MLHVDETPVLGGNGGPSFVDRFDHLVEPDLRLGNAHVRPAAGGGGRNKGAEGGEQQRPAGRAGRSRRQCGAHGTSCEPGRFPPS